MKPETEILTGMIPNGQGGLTSCDPLTSSDPDYPLKEVMMTSHSDLPSPVSLASPTLTPDMSRGGLVTPDMSHGGLVTPDMSHGGLVTPDMSRGGLVMPDMSHVGHMSPVVTVSPPDVAVMSNGVGGSVSSSESVATSATDDDVSTQLSQLQEMVVEMRSGFTSALQSLSQIQYGDQVLHERVASNKAQYEQQLSDVVGMVLSLKTEFSAVVSQLQAAADNQSRLQRHVDGLQAERDILLEELEKQGAISHNVRQKYHSGRSRPSGLNRSSESTTLASLLDRAHSVFGTPRATNDHVFGTPATDHERASHGVFGTPRAPTDHVFGTPRAPTDHVFGTPRAPADPVFATPRGHSDRDSGVGGAGRPCQSNYPGEACSCGDVTPPSGVNPLVHSYIAGLTDSAHHMSAHDDLLPGDPHYNSDSSITAAANKSLDLSRSLGDKCADVAAIESSGDEEEDERIQEEAAMDDDHGQNGNISMEKVHPVESSSVFAQPMTPKRVAPHERNTKDVQRLRVAREIMETERKYCSNLWTILDLFSGPLEASATLSAKETSIMFPGSLRTIYDHHCGFLQKLEERMTNWRYHSVLGDVLCRFIESAECDVLMQYQTFVGDFPASLYQIRKSCKNNARFRKFLRVMQRHPTCEGLDIGSFMVTPIQRIPRYVLLLKQLLKHTDRDHPDHYYTESALERLGDFLNKLNDSIVTSMNMVGGAGADETPKPRRKLRIASFRSTNASSCEANSSKLADTSGVQAHNDSSMMSTSGTAGRFFNFSFLRESFRRKNQSVAQSNSTPLHNNAPPVNAHSPRQLNQSGRAISQPTFSREPSFSSNTRPFSQSFTDHVNQSCSQAPNGENIYVNTTMPVIRSVSSASNRQQRKRRPRHRRPKSGVDHNQSINGDLNGGIEGEPLRQKRSQRPTSSRPHSVMDTMSEASVRSSTVTSQSHWPATSQESLSTLTADTQSGNGRSDDTSNHRSDDTRNRRSNDSSDSGHQRAYEMTGLANSLPDIHKHAVNPRGRTSSRKLPVPPTQRPKTTTNAPKHSEDFGVYGHNSSGAVQSVTVDLGTVKAASHANIHSVAGSHSPSQQYINLALARSLTENHLDQARTMSAQTLPRTSTSLLETPSAQRLLSNHPQGRSLDQRPHSARVNNRHVTVRDDSPTIIGTAVDSARPLTPKKDGPSKRKKDRVPKKSSQELMDFVDGDKEKKKGSIKESLKNIFFRKRKHEGSFIKSPPPCKLNVNKLKNRNNIGSKMLDIAPLDELPENGHQVYVSMATPYPAPVTTTTTPPPALGVHSNHNGRHSPRAQDPPLESVVVLEPVCPELETYEDENGEPCSAV